MSTPLVVLAAILALFALVLIPLMMIKGDRPRHKEHQHSPAGQGGKSHRKKKKR